MSIENLTNDALPCLNDADDAGAEEIMLFAAAEIVDEVSYRRFVDAANAMPDAAAR